MKKRLMIALSLTLICCLAACGRGTDMDTGSTTSRPTQTDAGTMPTVTLPTMDTNIPDETVNENSTEHSPATDGTSGGMADKKSMH